ncbi:MAG: MBL fold metallo-hydrolase [Rubrivivax sp.]
MTAAGQRSRPRRTRAAALEYPLAPPRTDGSVVEVAEGILWARLPMPIALDHVEVYLLRDDDGWTIVDTGLPTDATRALWERIAAGQFGRLPVKAVLCTHFHYDHAGLAGWLGERFGAPVCMTHGEYFTLRTMCLPLPDPMTASQREFFARAGMPEARMQRMWDAVRRDPFTPVPPQAFRRLRGGDELTLAKRRWRVVVGEGHSPEHACLYCEADRILIAGDQLLSRITSNVLVSSLEPEANPLQLWFDSLHRLERLAPDTLVLPSHQGVFRGLHARARALREHHEAQFAALRAGLAETGALTAFEAMGRLYPALRWPVDDLLALGETIAHLSWLRYAGQVQRVLDDDGIHRFRLAEHA